MWSLLGVCCLGLLGCGRGDTAFAPVPETATLPEAARVAVAEWVAEHFGTPAAPRIDAALPVDWGPGVPVETDAGPVEASGTLLQGRRFYVAQCVRCHGRDGGGDGPTASALNPRPRDFRLGIFKYTSTGPTAKARRDDLKATLRRGLAGTAMPSYPSTPEQTLDAVVEYVRWLAIRGEAETSLSLELQYADLPSDDVAAVGEAVSESGDRVLRRVGRAWEAAAASDAVVRPDVPRPPVTDASIAAGAALFASEATSCTDCHGRAGRGDGPELDLPHDVPGAPSGTREPGLWDAWGRRVRPRDLTDGVYRGGGEPLDLFRRLAVGVKGTPMPGAGAKLTDEDIWHLVHYVRSLAD